jgi:hypothetical protein
MLPRMGRWLRTLLAGLMVLLWIAVIALWIRSHWRGDRIVIHSQRQVQLGPFQPHQQERQYILITGDGGFCLATRATDIQWGSPNPPSRWQASKDPSYPQPWGSLGRTLTISSRGTLILNRVNSGSTITTFPTTSTFSLTFGPTTSPSTGTTSLGTLLASGSVNSMTISGSSVTVSPGTVANSSGSLSFSGGSNWTGSTTLTSGTLAITGVNIVTDFLSPLPPPENPPTTSFQFLAYRAGSAQDWMGRAHVVIVPFWFVAIAMTLLLLLVLRSESLARRRRWRASHGCCVQCGYDLRASSERCPECGVVIPSELRALSFQK